MSTMYFLKKFCFLRSRRQTQSIQVACDWLEDWESMLTPLEHEMLGGANPILVELLAVNGGKTMEIIDNVSSITTVETGTDFPIIIQTGEGRCFSVMGIVDRYKVVNSLVSFMFKDIDTGEEAPSYQIGEMFYRSGDDVAFRYLSKEELVEDFFLYDSHRVIRAGGVLYIFDE